MRRFLLLSALALALAACSGHTVHRVEVDLLSFVPQGNRSGELSLDNLILRARFPDDPGGQPVPVPGAEALLGGRIGLKIRLENTGTTPASVDLKVRLGPANDTDIYDGTGGDILAQSQSLSLNPGETQTLDLSLELQPNTPAFNLVKSGNFRIGAELSLSGEKVRYELTQGEVVLRLKLFNLIPNP
ncbi:hypothetical protein [Thermus sp.]|uniref:COG1470 family protein n=1 Tax=Thermus sp. TaxID=275 RepID=UPI002636DDBF|nr:hypothetical protein [Thermus sp.]MCX7849944.1 hypothetical protein [Thermus sp.]